MQTGVQPYSSRYVPQRYSEDKHGPHNDILPQYGVSRQRPNRPGEYWHPFAQGQALHLVWSKYPNRFPVGMEKYLTLRN